jgi:glycosyltransferase involved in cell wall biosynthesis
LRVLVAIPARLDSIAANAVNTFKMADGFARIGHETFLVCSVPNDARFTVDDLRARMSLSPDLSIVPTPVVGPDLRMLRDQMFARQVDRAAAHLAPAFTYSRAFKAPVELAAKGIPGVAEVHKISRRARFRRLAKTATESSALRALVTIAPDLNAYLMKLGVPAAKILMLQTGVDLGLFRRPASLPWQPPKSPPEVVYAGHLFDYKGIPDILDAARLMPEVRFTLVGGLPADIERHARTVASRKLDNVRLAGPRPHAELPALLWNADVLLLPPSAHHVSATVTSPVKLGEYLASGTPIVATTIPALQRLLSDREASMVAPDNGEALAAGIRRVLGDSAYAKGLSLAAMERAAGIGYTTRARAILDHAFPEGAP